MHKAFGSTATRAATATISAASTTSRRATVLGMTLGSLRTDTAECTIPAHVPTDDSSHRPKLVKATITASIQYWERIASRPSL